MLPLLGARAVGIGLESSRDGLCGEFSLDIIAPLGPQPEKESTGLSESCLASMDHISMEPVQVAKEAKMRGATGSKCNCDCNTVMPVAH